MNRIKIFLTIFFSLMFFINKTSIAQVHYTPIANSGYEWQRGSFLKTLTIPSGDSLALNNGKTSPGALFYLTTDSTVYSWTGNQWFRVGSLGSLTNLTATNNYAQNWTITNPTTTPNLSLVLDTTLYSTRAYINSLGFITRSGISATQPITYNSGTGVIGMKYGNGLKLVPTNDTLGIGGVLTKNDSIDAGANYTLNVLGNKRFNGNVFNVSTDSSGTAINGYSRLGYGIYGYSDSSYGVYGNSNTNIGVYGSTANGNGVYGSATNGYGVQGSSTNGYGGIFGSATNYGAYIFNTSRSYPAVYIISQQQDSSIVSYPLQLRNSPTNWAKNGNGVGINFTTILRTNYDGQIGRINFGLSDTTLSSYHSYFDIIGDSSANETKFARFKEGGIALVNNLNDTLATKAYARSVGGGGGSSTLSGLTDVNISSPSNLQLLQYQTSDGKWHNWTPNYLSSVDTTNISNFSVKVRSLLSATAPITYSSGTGVIAISQATTSTNGYLSSTDWNTFNNKLSAFGSQTANTFYAAPNGSAGTPTFRSIVAADIPDLSASYIQNQTSSTQSGRFKIDGTGSLSSLTASDKLAVNKTFGINSGLELNNTGGGSIIIGGSSSSGFIPTIRFTPDESIQNTSAFIGYSADAGSYAALRFDGRKSSGPLVTQDVLSFGSWNVPYMTIRADKRVQFNDYGDGTHTGTATKWAAFDVNGNVIEMDNPLSAADKAFLDSLRTHNSYIRNSLATGANLLTKKNDSTIIARKVNLIAGTNITIDTTSSNDSLFNATINASGGTQNLSWNSGTHAVDISGSGTSATVPYSSFSTDGLLSAADYKRWDSIKTESPASGTWTINVADGRQRKVNFTTTGYRKLSFSNQRAGDIVTFQFNNTSGSSVVDSLPSNSYLDNVSALIYTVPTGLSTLALYRYDGTNYYFQTTTAGGLLDPGSNGVVVRTSNNTTTARTITGGTGISVTNGDGVSGNPTAGIKGWQDWDAATIQTTDATATTVVSINPPVDSRGMLIIYMVGTKSDNTKGITGQKVIHWKKIGSTLTVNSITTVVADYLDGFSTATWTVDANSGQLRIRATGEAANTVDWNATYQLKYNKYFF